MPIDFPNSPIWHPQYLPRCDTPPIREQAQEAHCTKAPKRWYWGLANKRNIKCNRNHSKQLSKGRKKWATIVIKTPMHELVQCVGLGMTRACFLYWSHYVTIISRLWWRSAFNTRNSAIPVRWSWNESCTPSTCLLQNAIPRMNQSINQSIKPWLIQLLPNQSQTTSKEHSELIRAAEKQELIVDLDQKISREGAAGTLSFETRYVHNTII